MMNTQVQNSIERIKSLIANDRIEDAINGISECVQENYIHTEIENAFIILKNRYENYRQKEMMGLPIEVSHRNDIIHELLKLLSYMRTGETQNDVSLEAKNVISRIDSTNRNKKNFVKISIVIAGSSAIIVLGFSPATIAVILFSAILYVVISKVEL